MPVRCVLVEVDRRPGAVPADGDALGEGLAGLAAALGADVALGVGVRGVPLDPGDLPDGAFQLPVDLLGLAPDGPELAAAAAAAGGCFPRELLVVAPEASPLLLAAAAAGARASAVPAASLRSVDLGASVVAAVAAAEADDARRAAAVGVGPHPEPWPDDPHLDPALLRDGDRRNVVDQYRYWREEAIAADLAARAHEFHVAVENWQHDLNIGTVVRNANAFGAAGVHIVGERRWNRRGAMATDRYLVVAHHPDVADLVAWARADGLVVVGVDNVEGAVDLDAVALPRRAVLLFGQEGPGLTAEACAACDLVVAIGQHGSTRSLNAGVASGIAMHRWVQCHGRAPG
ncbi:MAG: RNA methyltransferase [Acidimicrobiales bacterium]